LKRAKKGRMLNMANKDVLYGLVADLVQMLVDYGAEINSIIHTLKYYGLTDEEIKSWYGLEREEN
jgi:hypothetical protein